jgi:hypothetical protein
MSTTFYNQRKVDYHSVNGVGSFTVDIDFVPNFITTDFHDVQHIRGSMPDTVTWDLATTGTGYQLTVNYNTGSVRKIKTILAKLSKDPEQTISFGA